MPFLPLPYPSSSLAPSPQPLSLVSNSSIVPPSKLEPKTRELMEIIFDLDMFKSAMTDIKVDLTRMPLGAITVSQLDKGYAVLKEIETMLQKKSLNSRERDHLISLSGNFYQVIPHSYPRHQRPPPIDSVDMLTEKLNMINTLKDIEVAQSVMGHAAVSGPIAENPIDAKYRQLDSDIELLDPTSPDYGLITTFMNQTMGYRKVQLYNIWALRRHPEDVSFPPFEALDNHQLLWHGTNIAVVAAILKTGLRIMPAVNGGRVGRGIYLADKLEKSVSYVRPARRPDGTQFGIAFLSQAAMGRVAEITRLV
jgi:poly [ADP-ribose] polymerase 2/3/4